MQIADIASVGCNVASVCADVIRIVLGALRVRGNVVRVSLLLRVQVVDLRVG